MAKKETLDYGKLKKELTASGPARVYLLYGAEEYLREDFFRVKHAFYAVWEENGSYICALRMEPFEDGLLLEALETAPTHRRSGYATKLIEAVLASLPKGSAVYAHVHKRNTASLATHRRCGFTVGLEHAKYVDGTVSHYACTMKIIV